MLNLHRDQKAWARTEEKWVDPPRVATGGMYDAHNRVGKLFKYSSVLDDPSGDDRAL